jgi:type VI secretion system protein ImpA
VAINIDEYLRDLSGENVCGDDLRYDAEFIRLEQDIKGKPGQEMGDTIIEAVPPNWRDIKKQSEVLLSRSIDLSILVFYLRALIVLEGFSGLEDGLELITAVVEKRWDSLYPLLDPDDDNDPTERINILGVLCDFDTFLKPLQQIPLLEAKSVGKFNFRDITIASGKSTATGSEKNVSQATIDAAVQDSEVENLQQNFQAIGSSLDYLNQLETMITDYVGISQAPSFAELRNFLKDAKVILSTALGKKGVSHDGSSQLDAEEESQESSGAGSSNAPSQSVSGAINNDQDVIKVLKLVCDYYRKNEPSSPVPMLVDRALRLVGKSFMDALKDIAPAGVDEAKIISGIQDDEE